MSKNNNELIGISRETAKANILEKLLTSREKEGNKNKIVRWKDLKEETQ